MHRRREFLLSADILLNYSKVIESYRMSSDVKITDPSFNKSVLEKGSELSRYTCSMIMPFALTRSRNTLISMANVGELSETFPTHSEQMKNAF